MFPQEINQIHKYKSISQKRKENVRKGNTSARIQLRKKEGRRNTCLGGPESGSEELIHGS